MMCSRSCRQLRLLLWKNWILHKRKWGVTLLELLLPAVFCLLLLVIRQTVKTERYDEPTTWPSFSVDALPPGLLPPGRGPWLLAYSPNTSLAAEVMDRVVAASRGRIAGATGFDSEQAMLDHLAQPLFARSTLGGVVLSSFPSSDDGGGVPKAIRYKIRLPSPSRNTPGSSGGGRLRSASWQTQFTFPVFQQIGPREPNETDGGSPGYYREGFLSLQHLVDQALIAQVAGGNASREVWLQRIPYPPYVKDFFILVLQQQFAFLLLLGFIFTALNITKNVVHEKERKLKETMKMMGLQSWLHWTAWFIHYFVMLGLAAVLIVGICYIPVGEHGRVLTYSAPSVVLVFLLLYVATVIFFCFAISVFFNTARAGAAAGGLLFLFSYIPYSFIQPRYSSVALGLKLLSCLLPNMALALGCQLIGMFEGTGAGVQWANLTSGASVDDSLTLLHVFGMLLADCVLFMLVAWYKEMVRPGNYGIPQPWYFPFTAKYWCGTERVTIAPNAAELYGDGMDHTASVNMGNDNVEPDPAGLSCSVAIRGLTKVYHGGAKKKVAVNDLSINIYEGQITALLGHNGAGKTTTMSIIAGFIPPTTGQVLINGLDIRHNLNEVRRQLGLCPQHDILFDQLTVEEHLRFFAKLKAFPEELIDAEVDRLIAATHLEAKRHWLSKTLSGGMKRKLSVAIALVGDSKIVILDEPTSGMDPSARRELWAFLQAERSRRTMLLSTHFMDEADFLGDRVAIMAAGEIQCCGSSLFLKSRYGAGYHLTMVRAAGCDERRVVRLIQELVPAAQVESSVGDELSVVLPTDAAPAFEQLFTALESNREELGIASYGASVTTMEEVFLKVGEGEVKGEPGEVTVVPVRLANGVEDSVSSTYQLVGVSTDDYAACRNRGAALLAQQFQAVFVKRLLHSWRNLVISVSQLVVPIVFTALGLLILKTQPGVANSPPLVLTLARFGRQVVSYARPGDGSPLNETAALVQAYVGQFASRADTALRNMTSGGAANQSGLIDQLVAAATGQIARFNRQFIVGAFLDAAAAPSVALFNDQAFHSPAISLNALSNAFLRATAGPDHSITTVNAPQPLSDLDKISGPSMDFTGLPTAINVVFGMAYLASSFSVFLVKERTNKVKHLQFVAGINKFAYWFATLAWDAVNFLVPCVGLIIVFLCFQEEAFSSSFGRTAGLFLLLILYCWAVTPLMYNCSYLFSVPSTALVWLSAINFITGLAPLVTVAVLQIPQLDLEDVAKTLKLVFTFLFPNFCLGQAIVDYYSNYVYTSICQDPRIEFLCTYLNATLPCCKGACSPNCADWTPQYLGYAPGGIGLILTALFGQGVLSLALCLFLESSLFARLRHCLNPDRLRAARPPQHRASQTPMDAWVKEDSDVASERDLVMRAALEEVCATNSLVMRGLTHYYGTHCAVDRLTCGVAPGECFGLLGINGAGKTTTFKMLTGDLSVSAGDAFINGHSVTSELGEVQRSLGYCPQFDGLIDQLTGRETLVLFARLRGLREDLIPSEVGYLLTALLLQPHADRLTATYSGGNKRKLSTAMALVGGPPVVCLDEPTTGMDPVARRHLWRALANFRERGHTLVLTSHSMEECEALCTKIGIMVNGQFKCFGACQHLKAKFGSGYSLLAQVPFTQATGDEHVRHLKEFVETHFPSAELIDVHQGVLHYQLHPHEDVTWARVFGTLERSKDALSLENYSVSQTTLEQVFLGFARSQFPPHETKASLCASLGRCCGCSGQAVEDAAE